MKNQKYLIIAAVLVLLVAAFLYQPQPSPRIPTFSNTILVKPGESLGRYTLQSVNFSDSPPSVSLTYPLGSCGSPMQTGGIQTLIIHLKYTKLTTNCCYMYASLLNVSSEGVTFGISGNDSSC